MNSTRAMCFSKPPIPVVVAIDRLSIKSTGTELCLPSAVVNPAERCPVESIDIVRCEPSA